jgi:acyl-CoA thioesterase I
MAGRVARPGKTRYAGTVIGLALAASIGAAAAQVEPAVPFSRECRAGGTVVISESPLPNVAAALREGRSIRILTIGAAVRRKARGSYTDLIQRLVERAIEGLDVEIVNRSVSGELAGYAAERIKLEVALNKPELVLWQVGTNDALAYVPVAELEAAIVDTIRWLKEHQVDVVLAGLQFVTPMEQDEHYKNVREMLRRVALQENVVIVRRYEAMHLIAKAARTGPDLSEEIERTEAGYNCLAEYVARAITLGAFGRSLRPPPGQSPDNPQPVTPPQVPPAPPK